jgi:hypothetical protein
VFELREQDGGLLNFLSWISKMQETPLTHPPNQRHLESIYIGIYINRIPISPLQNGFTTYYTSIDTTSPYSFIVHDIYMVIDWFQSQQPQSQAHLLHGGCEKFEN